MKISKDDFNDLVFICLSSLDLVVNKKFNGKIYTNCFTHSFYKEQELAINFLVKHKILKKVLKNKEVYKLCKKH
jgi:hypothetical protein